MKTILRRWALIPLAVGACCVRAATLHWDGDSSTVNAASDNTSIAPMNWLSGGNWDNGATSASLASWTANDAAVFGGAPAGTQTVNLGAPISLSNLDIGPGYLIAVNTGVYNSLGIPSGPVIVGARRQTRRFHQLQPTQLRRPQRRG